jgi:hypothetical protein
MKALLGDDRYAKSQQMATASAAAGLQQDLAKVNPNDSQFQRLLQVQQQWNDQRLALDNEYQNDPTSPDYAAQLKTLNDKRDQEYRQTLGADAFNTFQEGQDPGYNQMKKFETIWGLDDSRIDSVYATMKYYQKGVEDYTQNAQAAAAQGQTVDWDTVNKNLQQFSQQTQQALQNYLGQDTFNKMLRNGVFDLNPPAFVAHNNPSQ